MPSVRAENFAEAATRYVEWVDRLSEAGPANVRRALELVSELYCLGLRLPEYDLPAEHRTRRMTHDAWQAIYRKFAAMPFGYYSEFHNPFDVVPPDINAAAVGNLADDLADIYRDVTSGLELYRAGHEESALEYWRYNFEIHWAMHASVAIYVMQAWLRVHPES